jgi:hypothetical protein
MIMGDAAVGLPIAQLEKCGEREPIQVSRPPIELGHVIDRLEASLIDAGWLVRRLVVQRLQILAKGLSLRPPPGEAAGAAQGQPRLDGDRPCSWPWP